MQKARLRPISIAPFLLPRHLLPTSTCTTGRREARSSWSHSGRGWHCSHKYTPERDGSPHPERSEGSQRPSRQTLRCTQSDSLQGICHPECSEGSVRPSRQTLRCTQSLPSEKRRGDSLQGICHPERSEGSRADSYTHW